MRDSLSTISGTQSSETPALLHEGIDARTIPGGKRALRFVLITVWVLSLSVLCLAAKHRPPRPDEGHFSSPAYNLAHYGFFGMTTIDPDVTGLLHIRERTYFVMPLYLLLQAAWLKLFPATILSVRLLTIVLLVPTAWQLYRIVEMLTSSTIAAMITAALLPLDYAFMFTAVSARPDILCLLLGVSGLASYLALRTESLYKALFWSSFWLALSALTHPNAILYLAALALLVFWYDRSRINLKAVLLVMFVSLAVLAPWGYYVFQDYAGYKAQMLGNVVNNHRFATSLNPVRLIADELGRYANAYGLSSARLLPKFKVAVLIAYVAALFMAFFWPSFRSVRGVRLLSSLWAVYFIIQCVFNQKLSVYLVHIIPIYVSLVSVLLVFLWQRQRKVATALALWLTACALLQAGGMALTSFEGQDAVQLDLATFLKEHMSAAKTINGSVTLIYVLDFDPRLVEDHALGLTVGKRPDVIITDEYYQDSFAEMANKRPELLSRVRQRLGEYTLVKQIAEYRVYLSPEFAARSAGLNRETGSQAPHL